MLVGIAFIMTSKYQTKYGSVHFISFEGRKNGWHLMRQSIQLKGISVEYVVRFIRYVCSKLCKSDKYFSRTLLSPYSCG